MYKIIIVTLNILTQYISINLIIILLNYKFR